MEKIGFTPSEADQNVVEFPKLPVYYLPEELGIIETPSQCLQRNKLVTAMTDQKPDWRLLARAYKEQLELLVDQESGAEATYRRLGVQIVMAIVRRDAGRFDDYISDLKELLDDVDGLITGGYTSLEGLVDIIHEIINDEQERHQRP